MKKRGPCNPREKTVGENTGCKARVTLSLETQRLSADRESG